MIMNDKSEMLKKVSNTFPFLKDADDGVRNQVMTHAFLARIPKGKVIFLEGDECRHLALILSGTVRVYKPAESGREITLYRLGKGESCILTASCIFSKGKFSAIAVTEEEAEVAMVPAQVFREWMDRYSVWRDFIFDLLTRRLSDILATIEEVTFRRMDVRIAEYLLKLSQTHEGDIRTTHQDIAMELGTSREVVSRILKHFEYEKVISLGRGVISILDIRSLTAKTEQHAL